MYHLPFHHVKVFLTQEQQQYYGMIEERETSLKKQTMSGPWATPLNPKTRNTFEYVMWAILISLKYRKWQHELNWWMAIINSLPNFCFGMVYVISRERGAVDSNSLPILQCW